MIKPQEPFNIVTTNAKYLYALDGHGDVYRILACNWEAHRSGKSCKWEKATWQVVPIEERK
jgi:hypothetical protein